MLLAGTVIAAILVAVALIGGIVWLALRLTRDLAEAGRGFFTALAQEPVETIWSGRTTSHFRESVPWSEFAEVVARYGLDRTQRVHWGKRNRSGSAGLLRGLVWTAQGCLRAEVRLRRDDGVWLIDRLTLVPRG